MQVPTDAWCLTGLENQWCPRPLRLANPCQAVLTRPSAVLAQHELITICSGTHGVVPTLVLEMEGSKTCLQASSPFDVNLPLVITKHFEARPILGTPILRQHLCPKLSRQLGPAWKALSPRYAESCHLFCAESRISARWNFHVECTHFHCESTVKFDAYDAAVHAGQ